MDDSIADEIDELYQRFTRARVPVQYFESDEKSDVAIVFERINRLGVELDTLQLLSAWSWSDDFDLLDKFTELSEILEPFGFKEIGKDNDLLLRCCSAILNGSASPSAMMELDGKQVRQEFAKISSGIQGAIDFLRTNLNVHSTKILPYSTIIIPLSVFFATDKDQSTNPTEKQHKKLVKWIWRVFFTRRYSKRLEQLNSDISEISKLKIDENANLGEFSIGLEESFFTKSNFSIQNVNTKTFVLMLADASPLSFINGGKVPIPPVLRECNKKEFHHIFPKSFLKSINISTKEANVIANFCMISRADNNLLGGDKPSKYKEKMPSDSKIYKEILNSSLCPDDISHDDYHRFILERSQILLAKANSLMGLI